MAPNCVVGLIEEAKAKALRRNDPRFQPGAFTDRVLVDLNEPLDPLGVRRIAREGYGNADADKEEQKRAKQ